MAEVVSDRSRFAVLVTLALALLVLGVQLASVRPYLWPAGVGLTLSGDALAASRSEPRLMPRIRPPELRDILGQTLTVTRVQPGSPAAAFTITPGVSVSAPFTSAAEALRVWRDFYHRGPAAAAQLTDNAGRMVTLPAEAVWQTAPATQQAWLRQHPTALAQMAGYLAGAALLFALGTRGRTAMLMTLAFLLAAVANGGPMFGAEHRLPVLGPLLLLFGWLATPLSFPVIALAILHFPTRAPLLDRHPWVIAVLWALPAPVLVISLLAAVFLLGNDLVLAPLAWSAQNLWLFDASYALALSGNVALVVEGIYRYRTTVDASERRRIQMVVVTGVASVFAYALKSGVPVAASLAGYAFEWPWLLEAALLVLVLLPAVTLPYAVATKHVFSPRTVLRRSLQYALARRTLSVLVLLPAAALAVSLIAHRHQPLGEIVLGQPLFYAAGVGLFLAGLRYRVQAQGALDRAFFRPEYDARGILVALAARVPLERDPATLMSSVIGAIDAALHPESVALLAGEADHLSVLAAARTTVPPLPASSGLLTLLRWSNEPLEIYLDEERSPASRLPAADREWLAKSGTSLLVPINASAGAEARTLVGLLALGAKRSEEPYTAEDRWLLSGIAAQMGLALDLSRLRRGSAINAAPLTATPTLTPTMVAGSTIHDASALLMCATCHRCFDRLALDARDLGPNCPDDGSALQPVIGMPPVIDAKYRVDAVVGRGGMGAVFRARDTRLQRDVAVKVVRADLLSHPEARARFQREAQIVARLQHPAIVTVFDYGTLTDGAAFLVMELVRGEDLRRVLRREKALPPGRTIPLIAGVAAGVDAAHRAGVLHRDLKPENILLPDSATGPKVLDFGVAKMTDSADGEFATQGATIIGTPAYMAPEQLRGEGLDQRADVFSLAVVTYEALTGRLPYGAGSFFDVGVRQADGTAQLSFDGVGSGLAAALQRALSTDREQRPPSAAAFAEELGLSL